MITTTAADVTEADPLLQRKITNTSGRLSVLVKVVFAFACAISLLSVIDLVDATKFNDLSDDQQDDIIGLLNDEIFNEQDPLMMVLKAIERLKKAKNDATGGQAANEPASSASVVAPAPVGGHEHVDLDNEGKPLGENRTVPGVGRTGDPDVDNFLLDPTGDDEDELDESTSGLIQPGSPSPQAVVHSGGLPEDDHHDQLNGFATNPEQMEHMVDSIDDHLDAQDMHAESMLGQDPFVNAHPGDDVDHMLVGADSSHLNHEQVLHPHPVDELAPAPFVGQVSPNVQHPTEDELAADNEFFSHMRPLPLAHAPPMFHRQSSHRHHEKIEEHIETDGPNGRHEHHYEHESGVPFNNAPITPVAPIEPSDHMGDIDFPSMAHPLDHPLSPANMNPLGSGLSPHAPVPPIPPTSPVPISDQHGSNLPMEHNFEDSYIDTSDPNNPKHVHIENRNWAKVDPNGFSQERHESTTTTSLDNPDSYSHHHSSSSASSTSSSSSSYSRSSKRYRNNRNSRSKKWMNPSRTRLSPPTYAPAMLPIPMPVPYSLPMASPWTGYYPGAEYDTPASPYASVGYHPAANLYGGYHPAAAASAYGAYSPIGLGDYYPPSPLVRSKKSEKRRRRRANAALRRANSMPSSHRI